MKPVEFAEYKHHQSGHAVIQDLKVENEKDKRATLSKRAGVRGFWSPGTSGKAVLASGPNEIVE